MLGQPMNPALWGLIAVTVLLARFILKEAVTLLQWAGIAIIVAGVAGLSVQ